MLKNGIPSAVKNLENIAEFGRYDDLIALLPLNRLEILPIIKRQWEEDIESMEAGQSVSLLAKWLPSVNTSNRESRRLAHLIARLFGITPASYRKSLTALRKKSTYWKIIYAKKIIPLIMRNNRLKRCSSIAKHFGKTTKIAMKNF